MLDKLDLVVEIEELLEECGGYPLNNDDKYPWELITSSFVENGKLSIENLLLWQDFIEPVTWEEFLTYFEIEIVSYEYDYPEIVQQHQEFINFLQINLQSTQIYRVNLEEVKEVGKQFEDTYFYCIIGLINDNSWLAITPRIDNEYYYGSSSQDDFTVEANKIVKLLKSNFKQSFALLSKFDSFLDDGYKIEISNDRNLILGSVLNSGCYCWTEEFVSYPKSGSKIYSKLSQLLIDNLSEVKQYNIWGYDGLFIYVAGIAKDGDWIGLYKKEEYFY